MCSIKFLYIYIYDSFHTLVQVLRSFELDGYLLNPESLLIHLLKYFAVTSGRLDDLFLQFRLVSASNRLFYLYYL